MRWLEKIKKNAYLTVAFHKLSLQLIKFSFEIVQFVGYKHRVALTLGLWLSLRGHFTWTKLLTQ